MLAPAAGLRKERRTNGHFPSSGGAGWGGGDDGWDVHRHDDDMMTRLKFASNRKRDLG